MESTHHGILVKAIAACVPSNTVSSFDSLHFSRDEILKITDNLGFTTRRVAAPSICTSDLCFYAAQQLLEQLQFPKNELDGIIFVSQTPDHVLPATAFLLQSRLGLPKTCFAFDVNHGCSGYVYGLWLANNLIVGGANNILVLAGDTINKIASPDDRATAFVFGDAGSATLVSRAESSSPIHTVLGSDGSGAQHLCVQEGSFRSNNLNPPTLFMDGSEVFAFTLREIPPLITKLLNRSGFLIDQIDSFIFHQANQFMLSHLSKRMKIAKEKQIVHLQDIGNTSSASIPVAITEHKRLYPNKVFEDCILAGFGVGWSWAGMNVNLKNTYVFPTMEFPK
jgi:3-oxoacyl-[acyl-carrier-protein] synthase III